MKGERHVGGEIRVLSNLIKRCMDDGMPPETTGIRLEPGSVLVMVSDGVTSEGDDWLRELLASWPGGDSQELAQLILADSRRHGGLKDDCAALALRLEKSEKPAAKRV